VAVRTLVLVLALCALCAGCGGKSRTTTTGTTSTTKQAQGFVTGRATLAGMHCGTIGLHGGAAIGRYELYICLGPDDAKLGIPQGVYVCWGFNDFGAGHEQPAVELNLLNAAGITIGGHVYPDTTVNCVRTLRAVASVL
jgi:hypothetical protein